MIINSKNEIRSNELKMFWKDVLMTKEEYFEQVKLQNEKSQ